MKKISVIILMAGAMMLLSSCAGVFSLRNPKISKAELGSRKSAEKLAPVKFEDFENGAVVGGYSYANTAGGASASYGISDPDTDKAKKGQYAAKAVVNTGTDSDWGCGWGSMSSYGSYIDAAGREFMTMWVKAPNEKTFYVFCNESAANGADGEFWNSPSQTGAGDWTYYEIPFDEFFRNIYSGNQEGNLQMDISGIGVIGLQAGGNQGKFELLIDEIWIK